MVTELQPDSQSEQPASAGRSQGVYGVLFQEIQKEWNKAEESIKRSEQVALEVAIPAISELRYAGRRIVDALTLMNSASPQNDRILALLEDARFCCHRAQHDAIDAAMAKIAIDLDDLTSHLGFDAVIHSYPNFREFYAEFAHTRDKIAASRGKREDRNVIYDNVSSTDLPSIIKSYDQILIMRPVAKGYKFKAVLGSISGLIIMFSAFGAMVFAGMSVDWPKWYPVKSVAAQTSKAEGNKQSNNQHIGPPLTK